MIDLPLYESEPVTAAAAAAAYRRASIFDAAKAKEQLLAKIKVIAVAMTEAKLPHEIIHDHAGQPMLKSKDVLFAMTRMEPDEAQRQAVDLLSHLHVWREDIAMPGDVLIASGDRMPILTRGDLATAARIVAHER